MSKDPEVVIMPLAELRRLTEAIERVRELALNAIEEQELSGGKVTVLPSAILKALDGEQE